MNRRRAAVLSMAGGILLSLCLGRVWGQTPAGAAARDVTASEQFDKAQAALVQGDEANEAHHVNDAVKAYSRALRLYTELSKRYPGWQATMVTFRVNYCNGQLESLMKRMDRQAESAVSEPAPADPDDPAGTAAAAEPAPVPGAPADPAVELKRIKTRARNLIGKGKDVEARELLIKGLRIDPDEKTVRQMIGVIQCRTGNFEDAAMLLSSLVEEDPSNALARVTLGTAYMGCGRYPDAGKELKRAIEINPKLPDAWYNMAQLYRVMASTNTVALQQIYKKSVALGGQEDREMELYIARRLTADAEKRDAAKAKQAAKP